MTTITVRVPMTPPYELSPNASREIPLGLKIRLTAEWKQACYYAAVEARAHRKTPIFSGDVKVLYRYWKGKGRQSFDDDNLIATCKKCRDQLEEAGILFNDRQVKQTDVEQLRSPDGIGRLDVLITPLEES